MNSSDEQSVFDGLHKIFIGCYISFLSLQMSEFRQSEMKQKFYSVQRITHITATAGKKIAIIFCVSVVLCFPPQSAV